MHCESHFNRSSHIIVVNVCYFLCSDITALAKDKVYTHINLEQMTIHQVSASKCYARGYILANSSILRYDSWNLSLYCKPRYNGIVLFVSVFCGMMDLIAVNNY